MKTKNWPAVFMLYKREALQQHVTLIQFLMAQIPYKSFNKNLISQKHHTNIAYPQATHKNSNKYVKLIMLHNTW